MKYARLTVVILVSYVLGSSVPAMPRSEPSPNGLLGQSLICFYRGLDWDSKQDFYAVHMRDESVGGLARSSFLYHLTTPGRRIVFVEADMRVSRSFMLRSGETYYIRVDHRKAGFLSGPKLQPVDPAKGIREIRKLTYSGPAPSDIARQYCLRDEPS